MTKPDILSFEFYTYNQPVVNSNNIKDISFCERIGFCISLNPISYQANVGNWFTNIIGYSIRCYDDLPVNVSQLFGGELIQAESTSSDFSTICVKDLRIDDFGDKTIGIWWRLIDDGETTYLFYPIELGIGDQINTIPKVTQNGKEVIQPCIEDGEKLVIDYPFATTADILVFPQVKYNGVWTDYNLNPDPQLTQEQSPWVQSWNETTGEICVIPPVDEELCFKIQLLGGQEEPVCDDIPINISYQFNLDAIGNNTVQTSLDYTIAPGISFPNVVKIWIEGALFQTGGNSNTIGIRILPKNQTEVCIVFEVITSNCSFMQKVIIPVDFNIAQSYGGNLAINPSEGMEIGEICYYGLAPAVKQFHNFTNEFCITMTDCRADPCGLVTECDNQWKDRLCQMDKCYASPYEFGDIIILQTTLPDNTNQNDLINSYVEYEFYNQCDELITGFANVMMGRKNGKSYQNWRIDTATLPADCCWYIKMITLDSDGNQLRSKCSNLFSVEKECDKILKLEGLYTDTDCCKQCYGDPDEQLGPFIDYQPTFNIRAEICEREGGVVKDVYAGKSLSSTILRNFEVIMCEPVPDYVHAYIQLIMASKVVKFNGLEYEFEEHSPSNALRFGKMFHYSISLQKECINNFC